MPAFARSNRLPFTWHDSERADDPSAAALVEGLDEASLPLVRLPDGVELRGPIAGQLSGRSGSAVSSPARAVRPAHRSSIRRAGGVRGGLPMFQRSGHDAEMTASGVKQPHSGQVRDGRRRPAFVVARASRRRLHRPCVARSAGLGGHSFRHRRRRGRLGLAAGEERVPTSVLSGDLIGHPVVASTAVGRGPRDLARCRAGTQPETYAVLPRAGTKAVGFHPLPKPREEREIGEERGCASRRHETRFCVCAVGAWRSCKKRWSAMRPTRVAAAKIIHAWGGDA
jgi:hypothetical protein